MLLAEVQTVFTQALKKTAMTTERKAAEQLISLQGNIPADQALKIYISNITFAHCKALENMYPACVSILGATCFMDVAELFFTETPSCEPNLNDYGKNFGDFLDQWLPQQTEFIEFHYLADLARLEWLYHRAYYADDTLSFDMIEVQSYLEAKEDGVTFLFSHTDSVGCLQSNYPSQAIREMNMDSAKSAEILAIDEPEYLVISRPYDIPKIEKVSVDCFKDLQFFKSPLQLEEAIQAFSGNAVMLGQRLAEFLQRGWLQIQRIKHD